MPAKKKDGYVPPKGYAKFNQAKFLNQELTSDQMRDLKGRPLTYDDLESTFVRLMEGDYKMTVSWDERNHCFTCWVIPLGDDHQNFGVILTGRGSTPLKAMRQACYKHFVIYDGGTWLNDNGWGAGDYED